MKKLIIVLAIFLLSFGCAMVSSVKEEAVKSVLPEGCIQTVIEGDDYSYQSKIDPRTIIEEWTELTELRQETFMWSEFFYLNPDLNSNILVASFLKLVMFEAFSYLVNGEVEVFHFEGETKCYKKVEVPPKELAELEARLMNALGWKRS